MTSRKLTATMTLLVIAAALVVEKAVAQPDYDAQIRAMKRCEHLTSRATDLMWEAKREGNKTCGDMPDRVHGEQYMSDGSVVARERRQKCFDEVETEYRRTLEDITFYSDECFSEANSL